MNTLKIESATAGNFNFKIPSNWSEINTDQFLELASIRFRQEDVRKASVMLLAKWMNISTTRIRKLFDEITDHRNGLDIFALYDLTSWALNRPSFTKSLLPEIEGLSGPKDNMSNIIWIQFTYAEPLFVEYLHSKDDDKLLQLLASLYTPKGEIFDKTTIEQRAENLKNLPRIIIQAMLLNWIGLRNDLTDTYSWFSGSDQRKDDNKKSFDEAYADYDPLWPYKVLLNLPEGDWGTLKERELAPVHDVFQYLDTRNEMKDELQQRNKDVL